MPTSVATASPTATGASPTEVADATVRDGPLAPGTYVSETIGPRIGFRLDDAGWTGFADNPDEGFALWSDELRGGMTVTNFRGEVFAEPCGEPPPTESLDRSAAAFVAWLREHPELRTGEPVETTLGGHPATQLDVTSDVPPECPNFPRIWLWTLPVSGDFHLNEDESARFIVADVTEVTLVVVIETFGDGDHEAVLAKAQPVLDSLTIE